MSTIYASAYLTIAATRSENVTSGLFEGPLPQGQQDQKYWFNSAGTPYPVYAVTEARYASFFESTLPLLTRAWAY